MKISPEPLSPLRNWRELWQPEHIPFGEGFQERTPSQAAFWKEQKRTSFRWLNHLFNRESNR